MSADGAAGEFLGFISKLRCATNALGLVASLRISGMSATFRILFVLPNLHGLGQIAAAPRHVSKDD